MAGKKELVSISQAFANIADALETRSGDNVVYYPEYQSNPNGFLKDVLGIDQWEIPSQIIDSVWANGRTTVRSCHSSSKSFSAAAIALTFLHTYRPSTVITTAPGGRQAKEVIWAEIHDIYHKAKKPLGGRLLQTKLSMSETEKWVGLGFAVDEDRPETLQGYHNQNILIIVDEACMSADTEILTNDGWKYFSDLTGTELVLTKDPETNRSFYTKPTAHYIYPYIGDMYECNKPGRNFCVTPGHRMWTKNPTVPDSKYCLKYMKDINNPRFELDKISVWAGNTTEYITLPIPGTGRSGLYSERHIRIEDWAEFLGWYLAEGSVSSDGYSIIINQSYTKHPEKCQKIVDSIRKIGFEPNEHPKSNKISVGSKQLGLELSKYGKSLERYVPQCIKDATVETIKKFLDSFRLGDGYDNGNGVYVYCTSSTRMRDDLQEMIAKVGCDSSYRVAMKKGTPKTIQGKKTQASHDHYQVLQLKGGKNKVVHKKDIETVHYEGMVYCVSVEPHHLIFTRRNGYCMWSGNSGVARPIFEAIEGLLSSGRLVRLLLIGNPNDEATMFGDSFREGSVYVPFHISAFDTPNFTTFGVTEEDFKNNTWKDKVTGPYPRPYLTSPEWAYNAYKTYGPDSPLYMVRVRGDFPPISEDTLIPLPWIEKATDAKLPGGAEDKTWVGVDVARFGTDESVLTVRRGDTTLLQKAYNSLDGFFLADKVEEIMSEFGIDASQVNVDEIGIGGSPIDFLRHREKYVKAINASSKASDTTMYVNVRAEMYYTLRNRFKNGTISIPKSDLLIDELSKIKYKFNSGKIQIEDKKEMKKRIGKSPDRADSIAMAYYEPKGAPLADLGSLQRPKSDPNTDPRTKIYDDDTYGDRMNSLFKSEVPDDVDTCPKCSTHIGLEYRTTGIRSNEKEGMEKLCLICRTKWVRDGHTWVEKIVD